MALAALVKTVFYDEPTLQEAYELTADWTYAQLMATLHNAHKDGLDGLTPNGEQLRDYAHRLLGLASAQANADQLRFLQPLL